MKKKNLGIMILVLLSLIVVIPALAAPTANATAPVLTLSLNTTADGNSTPLVTNITSAVLLNTANATVATATLPDNMTANFNLSDISPGDYFIMVNGHANALVPTRIDSNTSNMSQYVGLRMRNSVIGNISNPVYRIKSYPSGISSSHPVVNFATGANESKYAYVIVSGSASKIEVRVLNTSEELSNFSTALTTHDGLLVPFQTWILGDVKDSTGAFIGNHGHLGNATVNTACIGCHVSLDVKPTTFPPITGVGQTGWCFRCHNGPGGPSKGFIDPAVAPNQTLGISVSLTNVTVGIPTNVTFTVISNGSVIPNATVTLSGNATGNGTTGVNGTTIISVNATGVGSITATASMTNYTSGTATVMAVSTMPTLGISASLTNVTVGIPTNVTFTVISNGSVIPNATVTLSGNATGNDTTDVNGTAIISVNATGVGSITATASMTNHTSGTATVMATMITKVVIAEIVNGSFEVNNGSRSGTIHANVNVTNLDSAGHWFVVVVSGTDTIRGYPLVGTGTVYVAGNQTNVSMPILVTIPVSAYTGNYNLYAGLYDYDNRTLTPSDLIGDIIGPEAAVVT